MEGDNVKSSLRRKERQGAGSLARRIFEFVGVTRAYVGSIGAHEEDVIQANFPPNHSNWKPVETALLEAEYQKGKAMTQLRRRQIL